MKSSDKRGFGKRLLMTADCGRFAVWKEEEKGGVRWSF